MSGNSLRASQRAPRSCIPCSTRKVKCDKAVPCTTCVRRGESANCRRETVLIRGEPRTWQHEEHTPTTEELAQKVEALEAEVRALKEAQVSHFPPVPAESGKKYRFRNGDSLENALWDSLRSHNVTTRPKVTNWSDIVLPSRSTSNYLVVFDRIWNSWVHYALEYPRFQYECDAFMDAIEGGMSLGSYDPSWLAVYFSVVCVALLMMGEEAVALVASEKIREPMQYEKLDETLFSLSMRHSSALLNRYVDMGVKGLNHNWYDAAIFCLHRADFMRVSHICTVQSIAILGMCFNSFGDADFSLHLWSIAIRTAQRLKLDTPSSQNAGELTPEAQHRLWWTLTICEWLKIGDEPSQIEEVDFDVPLPIPKDTSQSDRLADVDPVHYHIFMVKIAAVYNRFRQALLRSTYPIEDIVRAADEELAVIIDTLPEHLQPDVSAQGGIRELELSQPWIKWQRFDITLVLLHHRLRINRTLQDDWLSSHGQFAWARAVCVQASLDIVWINRNWDQPVSMRKQWALSFHLFVASALLLRELQSSQDARSHKYKEAIEVSIALLEQIQSENELARHAADILRDNMHSTPSPCPALLHDS